MDCFLRHAGGLANCQLVQDPFQPGIGGLCEVLRKDAQVMIFWLACAGVTAAVAVQETGALTL